MRLASPASPLHMLFDRSDAAAPRGSDQFLTALLLAFGGWIGCVLLQAALYLRPAPHGGAVLVEWGRYVWLAIYYDLLGVWLLSLPSFLIWLILYRRELVSRRWRIVPMVQAGLLALNLALSQIDHEVLRFLGGRLNLSFLQTYGQPGILSDALFADLLRDDRGGPYLALVLLVAAPALYLWWAIRRLRPRQRLRPALWLALLLTLIPLAAPANGWRMAESQFRLRKVEPVTMAIAVDAAQGFEEFRAPPDLDRLIAEHQTGWRLTEAGAGWRFADRRYPYLRVPTSANAAPAERPWNILYIQLETLRGADTGFLRPDLPRSPTPYLDALARAPASAAWTRAISFGMPSINGLFATHCSIAPPSRRYITALTHVRLLCLPELLRAHGYRAEMFNGGDTDWDNSSPWLRRWYDRLWRFPDANGRDREIFRGAAAGIRRLGRSGRPFFAAVVSVSNHTPFVNPEPRLDISGRASAGERIRNTTRYTDDVLREFVESLRGEPWFERTLLVITGDHGFNTGEHGQVPGQHNLFRESVWVPLVIAGRHPRLRAGASDAPASLLDVAPTLADLLGLRRPNPWQGHSLLAPAGPAAIAFGFRESLLADVGPWSAVRDPRDGRARLYRRSDWLQRDDLAADHPQIAHALLARAERARRLHDHLLRANRIWPGEAQPRAANPS